jgi:hypothetical protein
MQGGCDANRKSSKGVLGGVPSMQSVSADCTGSGWILSASTTGVTV